MELATLTKQLNKAEVSGLIEQAVQKVVNNEIDPINLAITLKAITDIAEGIRKHTDVKNVLMAMLDEIEGRKLSNEFATIQIVETNRKDYSNDPTWCEITEKINAYETERKQREKLLSEIHGEYTSPVTGEVMRGPNKIKTETVKVTLK